jgi:hypothetical protein
VIKRKPILLVDESDDSLTAVNLFKRSGIEYLEYNIGKFEESCCGGDSANDDMPTTKAPSVFAVEGVFKGLEKINEYVLSLKRGDYGASSSSDIQSESSAYW